MGAVCLLATACGGGSSSVATPGGIDLAAPEEAAEADAAFLASRPGLGIVEAGGTVRAAQPCPPPGTPGAAETVKIALVSPDVADLEVIGLGDLVFDTPGHIADAYLNKVNGFGGINGYCFEFRYYEYGFTDPVGDLGRICADLPPQEPLVLLGLGLNEAVLGCATLGAQVPTLGLYSQWPDATFAQAGGLLLVDHGAVEFLLDNGLDAAFRVGALSAADSVGLLYQEDDNATSQQAVFDAATRRLGLRVAATAGVPPELSGTGVLVVEQQFREMGGDVFDADTASFDRALAGMPPNLGGMLAGIRQDFLATAADWRDAGVTAVVASASWADVRNLMRAAELSGWFPKWIINDSHYALLVLTDAPEAQSLNVVQVSSRRAADDPVEGLDRGCLSLRNADTAAEPFSHRYHTDAWSLMTSTCDYLDVVFGAIARVAGPLTREAFMAALSETSYETAHGSLVRFSAGDPYGSDSFRVLAADPDCVLNDWGCMRSVTGWLPAVAQAAGGGGEASADG